MENNNNDYQFENLNILDKLNIKNEQCNVLEYHLIKLIQSINEFCYSESTLENMELFIDDINTEINRCHISELKECDINLPANIMDKGFVLDEKLNKEYLNDVEYLKTLIRIEKGI